MTFGIIGAGWRADFFLRIARDLPEQFPLAGIVVRNPEKQARIRAEWPGARIFASWQELVDQANPGFIVTSVGWAANAPLIAELVARGIPVLSETPIAPTIAEMEQLYRLVRDEGARIQVAEQLFFRPIHAARLALIASGRLGTVREVDVSLAHGYHGISLMRKFLGLGLELPSRITARNFTAPVVGGPGRYGPPAEEKISDSTRTLAQLDFEAQGKLGTFDFVGDQYFSWIRSQRLLVRGERGEISNHTVRYLQDHRTPVIFDLVRRDAGHEDNLEGLAHHAILGGSEILYTNPFPYTRWSDDDIAVATSLAKMQDYVKGGPEFYSVAEGAHDRYLDLLIAEAAASGQPVLPKPQLWNSGG